LHNGSKDCRLKFALNYSPQAAQLFDDGLIEFDLYKSTDWPDMVETARQQRPVYVHFPLLAGRRNIEKVGWQRIVGFLNQTSTEYVNTHLAPFAADFDGLTVDSRDMAYADRLTDAMCRDITPLVKRFGADRVILELACWDPDPQWQIPRLVLEPEIITRMVEQTGCGFLLDVAHARLNAIQLGMDERDYVPRLPMERLRELHITGITYDREKGRYRDHFAMTPDDWRLAEWALDCIRRGAWPRPWAVALEYGGTGPHFDYRSRADVLAEDVPRLYDLVRAS
jgi:uncharacterized protein (UPF0276 family)